MVVLAFDYWHSNGDLIADVARLGDLKWDWKILDATYGRGGFWSVWWPQHLFRCDLNEEEFIADFRALPFRDRSFDAVVFDPPYKLTGTPATPDMDERYGTGVPERWQDRMELIRDGAKECARASDRMLLVKCQDQVVSSKIRWQTRWVADTVEPLGFGLKHRFDFHSYREQPNEENRTQRNPRSCSSQLLVFQRGWTWED